MQIQVQAAGPPRQLMSKKNLRNFKIARNFGLWKLDSSASAIGHSLKGARTPPPRGLTCLALALECVRGGSADRGGLHREHPEKVGGASAGGGTEMQTLWSLPGPFHGAL